MLLILAGVTISALSGENGIINKAGEVVRDTQNATNEESEKLADGGITVDGKYYASIDDYLAGNVTYEINCIEDLIAVAYSVNQGESNN